jgi:fido (protein-threonine AMPylation protein)/DNA-binding transcriptional ArsR family regulator
MHPIIALRRLEGLPREITTVLSSAKEPISQVEIIDRLRRRVSQSTVSRALTVLVDAGIVIKTGTTRNAAFGLSPETSRFARPPHLRTLVSYDPNIIGKYKANETRWLPEKAADRMRAAAASIQHQLDASTYSRQIAERFLIDLSWASSAFEGNTYSYLETEALIKFGAAASGHDVAEATMIMNHKKAILTLLENIDAPMLNVEAVSRLHALLMRDALSPEQLGRIRSGEVRIGGSAYRPSADPVQLQADLGGLLWQVEKTENPFEASFVLLAGIPYLQPFQDGNKRTGRLTCNIPLLKAGLPPMSFISLDKADYLAGLISFYETHDLNLLADVVADGYVAASPSYVAAVAAGRQPRSVELRERQGIEEAIQSIVAATIEGEPKTVESEVAQRFAQLSDDDRKIVTESIGASLEALNEVNAAAWGVSPQAAAKYVEKKKAAEPTAAHGL